MKIRPFKEALVLAVGTTPQIITETICALVQQKPPVVPDRLTIVTTTAGRKAVQEKLLANGVFTQFTREFALPSLALQDDHIIVPHHASGHEIDDITSTAESEAMGDLITSLIRDLTSEPETRLHCSIAGGRKTMSFYMGAALQLFGRPWDRLYHVLVSPEFESNPHFFSNRKETG